MKKLTIASAILVPLLLTGCNDDSSSETSNNSPSTTATSSGKVIDGYVSGATVYLDMNFNSQLDSDEPSSISSDAGEYSLELTDEQRQCLGYAPIVVDVPVGAIDEDSGEVTEAYQMVLPPKLEAVSVEEKLNISPLTSAIWSAIESELAREADNLSCSELLNNESQKERILKSLKNAIGDVVRHYNISEEQLFSDFIESGDSDAHDKALRIVEGLKKSLADTEKLKEQYPEAKWLRVDYHIFDSRDAGEKYPEAWYRESHIFTDETSIFTLDKMSDDLSELTRTIIYGERTQLTVNDMDLYQSFELESRSGDESSYSCDIKEGIKVNASGKGYEITNLINKKAEIFDDCKNSDFSSEAYMRYNFVGYSVDDARYSTQYMINRTDDGFPSLNHWIDLKENIESLESSELITDLETLPYSFDDDSASTVERWFKSKYYNDGENEVALNKNYNGEFNRRTTYPNGTHINECSDDGVTWGECD